MPNALPQAASRKSQVATRWVELHDFAAATGQDIHAVMNKVSRGTLPAHLFPSQKHAGKKRALVAAHRMDAAVQRELDLYQQRYAAVTPDTCLAALHAKWTAQYKPALGQAAAEAKATAMVDLARTRHNAIQQYRAIDPKSIIIEGTGERTAAPAVRAPLGF